MSARNRRNIDKRIDAATAEANIVAHMRKYGCDRRNPLLLGMIGAAAFPGYSFKSPQGAALAVSRIARGMEDRGILRYGIEPRGYWLAELG